MLVSSNHTCQSTNNLKSFICSPSQLFFLTHDKRTMPMPTTCTFITEVLYLVAYVWLFKMTVVVKVMVYTTLIYSY